MCWHDTLLLEGVKPCFSLCLDWSYSLMRMWQSCDVGDRAPNEGMCQAHGDIYK